MLPPGPPQPPGILDPFGQQPLQYIPVISTTSSATQNVSTHIIADKRSHTIYDSELQLLLDCSEKTEAQASKSIDECTTFKHGSFLLYSQRGLLETHPLEYTCISVSGNVTVQEPTIQSVASAPEGMSAPTHTLEVNKTMGYNFPAAEEQKEKKGAQFEAQGGSVSQPVPAALSNILVMPKELVMHIESLKSGAAYSAVLRLPYPVALTDLSIPSTSFMSSVSVDVWPEDEGGREVVRVAHSSEIRDKSLMLGNLMPPPVCQFIKVSSKQSLSLSLSLCVCPFTDS